MNGGYSMIDSTSITYNQVDALYAQGKPVIVYTGNTAEPACIAKQGDSYLITTPTTVYTITPDGVTKAGFNKSVFDYIAETGVKNFVKLDLTVPSELECTVNDDKSLTVKANTTAIRRLTIATDMKALETGKDYILSGCIDGNANTTYHLGITKSNYAGIVYQTNAETRFTKTNDMSLLVLTVQAGQSWTKTFYPMIRNAEIENPEYMPYAPTNAELYSMILALESDSTHATQQETRTVKSKKGE